MPVTIIPASHEAKRHPDVQHAKSLKEFLWRSCPDSYVENEAHIVASSFAEGGHFSPSSSSFVRSAIEAYGRHSHLIVRPEDVWFTILVQLNFYMTKNAEAVRHLFVSHDGQEKMDIMANDWEEVIGLFRKALQAKIKTDWMSDWISPGFSTSTDDDERTATVLMIGLMKSYFDFGGGIICGIPSITLLGTKQDWERLSAKISRLKDFGSEPIHYAQRVTPILSRILRTFDDPTNEETRSFWDSMVQAKIRHSNVCGQPPKHYLVSGWILGFFYWNMDGSVQPKFSEGVERRSGKSLLKVDDIGYGEVALEDLPTGYAKAKFRMLNCHGSGQDGTYHGWVLAGNIGKNIFHGTPEQYLAVYGPNAKRNGDTPNGSSKGSQTASKGQNGVLSRLICGMNCFGQPKGTTEGGSNPINARRLAEKQPSSTGQMAETAQVPSQKQHESNDNNTTIQPLSGWFLFGPEKEVTPFFESEECWGPTVDALDSCDGIEQIKT